MHRIITQNKFLRKLGNAPTATNPQQQSSGAQAGGGVIGSIANGVKTLFTMDPLDVYANSETMKGSGLTGADFRNAFDASQRLDAYSRGENLADYDPYPDIKHVYKVTGNDKALNSYRSNRRYIQGLGLPVDKIDRALSLNPAMKYAIDNPAEFKRARHMRDMSSIDYLFDDYRNNERDMRIANGPLGAFFNKQQRNKVRSNFWLMELIWRIKKFFAEFGNWQPTDDPSESWRSRGRVYNSAVTTPSSSEQLPNQKQ